MSSSPRIAVLGFLPWTDPAREVAVRVNPSAVAAERCVQQLVADGLDAVFVPVDVSGDGISAAVETLRACNAEIVVAVGQTKTGPRVERFGRAPGAWAPADPVETQPWELAPDAAELAARLNSLSDPMAATEPFVMSEDAGRYFCDHLCVELVRESRLRPLQARFLHVTAIDDCPPEVQEARLQLYAKQVRVAVDWLLDVPMAAEC